MTFHLTDAQKSNYQRDGFLILENFFSKTTCDDLIHRAAQLIADFDPSEAKVIFSTKDARHAKDRYFLESADKIRFFFEEGALDGNGELIREKQYCINKIGHALHDLDPVFSDFSRSLNIVNLVSDLGIIDPLLFQSMYICKQPYIGGEVNCHQDNTYLHLEGDPVTGLWFALQDTTLENGCLWAIPGGHKIPLKSRMRCHGDQVNVEVFDASPWPLEKMQPLEVTRGSLIILHGLLPHMSKENNSPYSRHAYTLHVGSKHQEYAADNWLQRPAHFPFRGF